MIGKPVTLPCQQMIKTQIKGQIFKPRQKVKYRTQSLSKWFEGTFVRYGVTKGKSPNVICIVEDDKGCQHTVRQHCIWSLG